MMITTTMMLRIFLGICVAYAVLSVFALKSMVQLVDGLCAGARVGVPGSNVTANERQLAEAYLERMRVPKRFRDAAVRKLLTCAHKLGDF